MKSLAKAIRRCAGGKPKFVEFPISPNDAEWALENKNKTNFRRVSQGRVSVYVEDMTAGRWKLTHEAIAFDKRGNLLDGQHRLWAIVRSGKTVNVMLAMNMQESTKGVIDTGAPRSSAHVLKNRYPDLANANLAASIARRFVKDSWAESSFRRVSNTVVVELFKKHEDAIRFSIDLQTLRLVPRISISQVFAAISRAWYYEAAKDLKSFYLKLVGEEGVTTGPDLTARTLSNYLLDRSSGGGFVAQGEAFGKTITAIRGYCEGRHVKYLKVPKTDVYPIPE